MFGFACCLNNDSENTPVNKSIRCSNYYHSGQTKGNIYLSQSSTIYSSIRGYKNIITKLLFIRLSIQSNAEFKI